MPPACRVDAHAPVQRSSHFRSVRAPRELPFRTREGTASLSLRSSRVTICVLCIRLCGGGVMCGVSVAVLHVHIDQRTKLKLRIGPEDRAVRRVDPHPCMGYDAVDSADSFAWTSLPRELGSSHPCLHRSHRHATHSSVRVAQHETRPTDQSTADDEHCASLAHTHKSLYGVSNARERAGAQLHQSLQQLDFQAVRAVCHID